MSSLIDQIEDHLPGGQSDSVAAETMWKGLTLGAGVLSTLVARQVVAKLWVALKGGGEPVDPADHELDWSTALQWSIASGIGVGVARLVGQRAAAKVWERATGTAPPGPNAESALRT